MKKGVEKPNPFLYDDSFCFFFLFFGYCVSVCVLCFMRLGFCEMMIGGRCWPMAQRRRLDGAAAAWVRRPEEEEEAAASACLTAARASLPSMY